MSEGKLVNHIKPIDFRGRLSGPILDDFENVRCYSAIDFNIGLNMSTTSEFTAYVELVVGGVPRPPYKSTCDGSSGRFDFPQIRVFLNAGESVLINMWIWHQNHDSEVLSRMCQIPYMLPAMIIGHAMPEESGHLKSKSGGNYVELQRLPPNHIKPIDGITAEFFDHNPGTNPPHFETLMLTATFREEVSQPFQLLSEAKGAVECTNVTIQHTNSKKATGNKLTGIFVPGDELSVSMFAYEDRHKPEGKSGLVVVPALP